MNKCAHCDEYTYRNYCSDICERLGRIYSQDALSNAQIEYLKTEASRLYDPIAPTDALRLILTFEQREDRLKTVLRQLRKEACKTTHEVSDECLGLVEATLNG